MYEYIFNFIGISSGFLGLFLSIEGLFGIDEIEFKKTSVKPYIVNHYNKAI